MIPGLALRIIRAWRDLGTAIPQHLPVRRAWGGAGSVPVEPAVPVPCPKPRGWFYIDAQGVPRGPFPLESMRQWYAEGYFPAGRPWLVKLEHSSYWGQVYQCS